MTRNIALAAGAALMLVGCAASSAPASTSPSPPPGISPSWTAVRLPDGSSGYVADVCYGNLYLTLTTAEQAYGHWTLGSSYGGKC